MRIESFRLHQSSPNAPHPNQSVQPSKPDLDDGDDHSRCALSPDATLRDFSKQPAVVQPERARHAAREPLVVGGDYKGQAKLAIEPMKQFMYFVGGFRIE